MTVAVLHAPDLPGAGVSCQFNFVGDTLLVQGEYPFTVPADSLDVSVGGFHDDTLFINWLHNGLNYSVVITDRVAQRELAATAPAGLMSKLKRGQGTLNYHRYKWRTVLGLLATILLAVVVVWWQSEAITFWLAEQVPVQREVRMGEAMLAQLKSGATLTQDGPAAEAVKSIGDRLTQGSRYQYQWYVKGDDSINAFAIPGGIVVVHSGLISKAGNAEELAGVLAHEIQHIERRHSLQQLIHSAGWAAVLTLTLGDVSAISGIFIHQLGSLQHSRKLEREADMQGVNALVRANISPAGMIDFFKKLQAEQGKTGSESRVALLSTHPATAERLAEISRLIKEASCRCQKLDYDWDVIRGSLNPASSLSDLGDRREANGKSRAVS